ncbi:MAG: hypothetical protein QMD05_03990, partial [Candidatus Brocadiaceae bacterium]|nr:hypothetical protein [Candidatus Brocadiaceae bacterium]
FFALLVNLFLPVPVSRGEAVPLYPLGVFFLKLMVLGYIMAWVETLNAKLRLFRIPNLLLLSLCGSFLALLSIIFVR